MGKLLQIRVTSWTYREEDVLSTWPELARLAWPRPRYPGEKRGVLELVEALGNEFRYGDWDKERKEMLREGLTEAIKLKKDLEDALANWDPRKANKLSDLLEDNLSKLETRA